MFVDQNNIREGYLCLVSQNKAPYPKRSRITLQYEIGVHPNPRIAHEQVVARHLGKPTGIPDERMIRHPIWSTWARYKVDINEAKIQQFADEILKNKFNNSQLEIDDNWETCYGSAEFNKSKFPNIAALTKSLKAKGFRVTLWIHPFINEGCQPAYNESLSKGYFVKNEKGQVHMSWWQGIIYYFTRINRNLR